MEAYDMCPKGAHLVVGVSGGPDSVCLLDLMRRIAPDFQASVSAVHVNHGIRGREAERDEKMVSELCTEWEIPLTVRHYDIPALARKDGIGLEEEGRKRRLQALEEEALAREEEMCARGREKPVVRIALGQHRKDNAETMLFHLFRGTSIDGLSGIACIRGRLIRPLLECSREEILQYLDARGLPYCIDATNTDYHYSRNRIRGQILPEAALVNRQAEEHIAQAARDLSELRDYLDGETEKLWKKYVTEEPDGCRAPLAGLKNAAPLLRRELYRRMVEKLTGSLTDLTREHLSMLDALLYRETGKCVCLPGGLTAAREYDFLVLRVSAEEVPDYEQIVLVPGVYHLPGGGSVSFLRRPRPSDERIPGLCEAERKEKAGNTCIQWLDCDRISNPMMLRHRREGDFFICDAQGSRKALQRYCIDAKLSRAARARMIVLAVGSEVLLILGGRMNEAFKVGDSCREILEVRISGLPEVPEGS